MRQGALHSGWPECELWPSRGTQLQGHTSPCGAFVQISKRCPVWVGAAHARHMAWRAERGQNSSTLLPPCPSAGNNWHQLRERACPAIQRTKHHEDPTSGPPEEACAWVLVQRHLRSWGKRWCPRSLLLSPHSCI